MAPKIPSLLKDIRSCAAHACRLRRFIRSVITFQPAADLFGLDARWTSLSNVTDCSLLAKLRANRKITKPKNTSGTYVKPMGPQGPPLVEGYYGLLGRGSPRYPGGSLQKQFQTKKITFKKVHRNINDTCPKPIQYNIFQVGFKIRRNPLILY